MSFRQLKWLALLAPIFLVAVLEYARYAFAPVLSSWRGHLLMDAVVLAGAIFFYGAVFAYIDHLNGQLARQNRELLALRSAGLDIAGELALDTVLQKVVDQATALLETRYGALSVYDDQHRIKTFVTSGLDAETIARIGPLPSGKGLLGVSLREGQRLRLADLSHDPRSCGFPADHPPMHSLLVVPVVCRGPFVGNLYLSEKHDGNAFSAEDEETLARFATQAAIAVDNAHLHMQARSLAVVQERLDIAHELHDGQAQVLAFVNAKAQAVGAFLDNGRTDEARAQLDQLAAAAREVYADVREGILGLRSASGADHGLAEAIRSYSQQWQDQSGIPVAVAAREVPDLAPDVELQLLRIVQESLTNVRKHARAERVQVELEPWRKGLRLVVRDDGIGFASRTAVPGGRPRFGLATMRERAESIGASLTIESPNDSGTRIELAFPGPL